MRRVWNDRAARARRLLRKMNGEVSPHDRCTAQSLRAGLAWARQAALGALDPGISFASHDVKLKLEKMFAQTKGASQGAISENTSGTPALGQAKQDSGVNEVPGQARWRSWARPGVADTTWTTTRSRTTRRTGHLFRRGKAFRRSLKESEKWDVPFTWVAFADCFRRSNARMRICPTRQRRAWISS